MAFDNHLYNLTNQLVQEHKSLWRIRDEYKKDAGPCEKCRVVWEKLERDKEAHVKELAQLVKEHL